MYPLILFLEIFNKNSDKVFFVKKNLNDYSFNTFILIVRWSLMSIVERNKPYRHSESSGV